ncbi:MAG: CMP-N,N'-diacetyllegionaminic acid synthase [Parvicella sp.]|jgi:CMP-N,N'-diacetyllegionaminic acid synthase
MRLLYLIPARGGSKGIPGKNVKKLGHKPLIQYSLEAARAAPGSGVICVSTDCQRIKSVVETLGFEVPFLRPKELSGDRSTTSSVIDHALDYYKGKGIEFDYVILLQPTSPFRTANHIKESLLLINKTIDMVVSVKETDSNPYYVLFEENSDGILLKSKSGTFTRRQDCPTVYELNGAIYIINVEKFVTKGMERFDRLVKYEMDKWHSIDIDDQMDWYLAETLMSKGVV